MIIAENFNDLWQARGSLLEPVALVPTMGFLHGGHLSLVKAAKHRAESVVVSIFVNPTQFNQSVDLEIYPKDIDRDLVLLEKEGVDIVWMPSVKEMYPPDFQTWVEVGEISEVLEGKMRPGHFKGVSTVVCKLFTAVRPDIAFFGQKDAQQVAVIQQMVRDLNFPIEIVAVPTVREKDGLAMSSRNVNLKPAERKAATVLYKALQNAQELFESGERSAEILRTSMKEIIEGEALAKIDYLSCTDRNSLKELEQITERALISMAVFFGKTRLIDNLILEK